MFKEAGLDAVILKHNIDSPFINHMEQKNEGVKFLRIDGDLTDTFKEETAEEDKEAFQATIDTLTGIFKEALGNDKLTIKVEKLKNENIASMITVSEESRRMQDMMKMYNMYGMDPGMFGSQETLVLNANHKLVQHILEHRDGAYTKDICEQLYDLAALSHGSLTPERMTKFIARSNELMGKLSD